ncbi:E3 ubiquitin-protein ligase RNF26 [Lethenteron reissneri]|uniref:E3 ubiquitin-protein ligase RNF26 n=1 Tax=Lethenteron reissneri TaxID=7753 RepID=UPI002AB67AE9|nr:E3 ubiquitin-protein ligase RNF26 [Lethenteron reissneri]XP_061418108.1 E3 ubiquitin-protein ligase RNF26 [Lethenteron reissneri]XP_061418109.1 E3 ubiquitin-protein ligase RNF26 [Lethenteron reissneri]
MMMALLLEALLSTGALFLRVYEAACFVLELHFALVSALLQTLRLLLGLPGAALGLVSSGAAGLLTASCRAACGGLALLRGLGLDCLGALMALPGATAEAALAAGRLPASAALGLAGGFRAAVEALGNAGAAFVAAVGSTGSAVGGAVVATGSVVTNAVEATASGAIASAMSAVGAVTDTLSGAVAATGGAFATLLNAAGSVIGWSVEVAAGSVAYTLGLATGALGATSAVATASLSAAVDFWLFALRLPLRLLTISFGAVATAVTLQGLFVSVALIGLSVWYLSPQPRRRAAVYARVPRPRLRLSAALRVAFANLTGLIRTALRRTAQGRHRQRLDVYPAPVPARIDALRPEPLPEPLPTEPVPDEQHEAEEAAAAVAAHERLRGEAARNGSGEAAVVRQQPWEQQEFPRQEEDEEDDNHKSCVICQDQPKGTVLLPCRHLCLCSACARTIMRGPFNQQKCPLCRKMIVHTMDVFM